MKLWIDDIRPAPEDYVWVKTVNDAKNIIQHSFTYGYEVSWKIVYDKITVIDIDHDAGFYANEGGDYIKLLDWLEENNISIPIRIHSMNPVGVQNMRKIIERNEWKEVE